MGYRTEILENLRRKGGPLCRHAADFIVAHGVRIGRASQTTGARWTLDGRIELRPTATNPADPRLLAAVVHEATHLEQGAALALTVAGELGGWQAEYRACAELHVVIPDSRWEEIARLPEHPSTADLRRARALMLAVAGYRYLIWLLPLRPNPLTRLVGWMQRLAWKGAPRA